MGDNAVFKKISEYPSVEELSTDQKEAYLNSAQILSIGSTGVGADLTNYRIPLSDIGGGGRDSAIFIGTPETTIQEWAEAYIAGKLLTFKYNYEVEDFGTVATDLSRTSVFVISNSLGKISVKINTVFLLSFQTVNDSYELHMEFYRLVENSQEVFRASYMGMVNNTDYKDGRYIFHTYDWTYDDYAESKQPYELTPMISGYTIYGIYNGVDIMDLDAEYTTSQKYQAVVKGWLLAVNGNIPCGIEYQFSQAGDYYSGIFTPVSPYALNEYASVLCASYDTRNNKMRYIKVRPSTESDQNYMLNPLKVEEVTLS